MMKSDTVYIEHLIEALDKVTRYIEGQTLDSFLENSEKQDAVIRQLEIAGEATKRISAETRTKNPEIPWSEMAGMRDKLIHDYIGVDLWIVWETAKSDVPEIKRMLQNLNY